MKNKVFRQLTVLTLALALVFSLTACVPDIHIHTGGNETENAASQNSVAENENTAADEKVESTPEEKPDTSVASSESPKSSKNETTSSKIPSSSAASSSKKQSSSTSSQISASKAKSIALKDAGLKPEYIDYVNVHGTSTGLGDVAESNAVAEVFGDKEFFQDMVDSGEIVDDLPIECC